MHNKSRLLPLFAQEDAESDEMSAYRVLFLTDNCDATVSWLAGLEHFERPYSITVADRSALSIHVAASFALIIIGVEADKAADALATCQRLRSRMNTPIFVISPLDDEAYALEMYKAGVDEYIVEPLTLTLLHAKLKAWKRWTLPAPSLLFAPTRESVRLN